MRRLLGRAALAGAVTLLALGPATVSRADEPSPTPTATVQPGQTTSSTDQAELDKVLAEVRAELAESSEQMVLAAADLRLTDQALPGARATVKRTQQLLAEAQRRQEQTALRRGRAQVRYTLSTEAAEETAAQVAEQQDRIGRLARAVYQGGGSLGNVSMLLEAQSPSDFAERLVSLQTVVSSQRSVLDDLATVQASFGQQTDDLERVRDDFAAADEQAQVDLQRVTDLADQARAAVTRVNSLVATRKAALAAAAQAQVADDAAHAHLVGESTQLAGQLAAEVRARAGPGRQRRRSVRAAPGRHAVVAGPRADHLTVRHAGAPGHRRLQAAHRHRPRSPLRHPGPRRPARRRRAGRLEQRLRLAHRGLPRRRRRRPAHDDVQPPDAHRRLGGRPPRRRGRDRDIRYDGLLDRVPPALRAPT